ncbi:Pheromone-processing carboxypeptidase KEX1 [Spathaspora sp. JA1]|nr:Pheromone-processing carboxypeptidase KEX1 [Spathaspora sp. JA1]
MLFQYLLSLIITSAITLAAPPKFEGSDLQRQYLVTNLPGLYENIPEDKMPLMFAGQLPLYPENNTNYFFWKFSDNKRTEINHNRTIFWFNGGPGCSSMDGALLEAGPFRINKNEKVVYNEGSWHHAGDVVFVDQPPGTGFSTADRGHYLHELYQVRDYFLEFMKKFFEMFPDEAQNEIYLAGESYAGQYIPYIADGILTHNEKLTGDEKPYDLRAVMIGNGWISPNEQSLSYFPWSYENGLIATTNPRWSSILVKVEKCQEIIDKIDTTWNDTEVHDYEVSSTVCDSILNDILQATSENGKCINMYDFTLRDTYPSCGMNWPKELKYVTPFLGKEEVMHDLNLKILRKWHECTGRAGSEFTARNSVPAVHLLPRLTEKIQVLLFNGDRDIICNTMGTLSFLKKLEWGGQKGFGSKDPEEKFDWVYDDQSRGYIKSARNMTFVNVYNSSHMVPYDVPEVSRSLIDLVTGNYEKNETTYITYPLGFKREADKPTNVTEAAATSSPTTTEAAEDSDEPTTNRITRIIQLLVILVILWGLFVLYSSYRSRPSSIIKKRNVSNSNNGNKKKNVQWADQLHSFEDYLQDSIPGGTSKPGFLTRTFNRLTGAGASDSKGKYVPASSEYIDDIELAEGISDAHIDDDFIIGDEDEEEEEESSRKSPESGLNKTSNNEPK